MSEIHLRLSSHEISPVLFSAKIADFGIARTAQPNQPLVTQIFTPAYAAPEQLTSSSYTRACDIRSTE